jgi:hypothetical protein
MEALKFLNLDTLGELEPAAISFLFANQLNPTAPISRESRVIPFFSIQPFGFTLMQSLSV